MNNQPRWTFLLLIAVAASAGGRQKALAVEQPPNVVLIIADDLDNYPHTPYQAGTAFQGTSQDGVRGDVMQELDWSVGEMMTALEEAGVADNTIVVFTYPDVAKSIAQERQKRHPNQNTKNPRPRRKKQK